MILKKGLKIVFNQSVATVLERKKGLERKTKFYLFDTHTKTYISNLYLISKVENSGSLTETYYFDYKDKKYLLKFNSDGTYEIVNELWLQSCHKP